jgi:hypothetical protein
VGPRAGLGYVEKRKFLTLPGLELRPLSRPARSMSLFFFFCICFLRLCVTNQLVAYLVTCYLKSKERLSWPHAATL